MMNVWDRAEETLAGLLGLIALIIGVWQVIGRYLDPAHAISYAEEVIVYLVIWAIMFASSRLAGRDGHVRADLVLRRLPPRLLRWVEVFNCLIAVMFCIALAGYGAQIVHTSYLIDERCSSDLQFPMWVYYLALPVGSGLIAARYAIRLLRFAVHFDAAAMTVGHAIGHEVPSGLALPVRRRPDASSAC